MTSTPAQRWTLHEDAPTTMLVRTADAISQPSTAVHRLSREETAAWNEADEEARGEARAAIRDAVREQGGGELGDTRGVLLEVVVERVR